jgi:hypothetical protein
MVGLGSSTLEARSVYGRLAVAGRFIETRVRSDDPVFS